jgi:hypothetical protein
LGLETYWVSLGAPLPPGEHMELMALLFSSFHSRQLTTIVVTPTILSAYIGLKLLRTPVQVVRFIHLLFEPLFITLFLSLTFTRRK